jgi:sulfhydrogenase subunit gamma (sulfur reductase)
MSENIYMPYQMRIEKVTHEAPGVKTFRLKFINEEDEKKFDFKAGQFGIWSRRIHFLCGFTSNAERLY